MEKKFVLGISTKQPNKARVSYSPTSCYLLDVVFLLEDAVATWTTHDGPREAGMIFLLLSFYGSICSALLLSNRQRVFE